MKKRLNIKENRNIIYKVIFNWKYLIALTHSIINICIQLYVYSFDGMYFCTECAFVIKIHIHVLLACVCDRPMPLAVTL